MQQVDMPLLCTPTSSTSYPTMGATTLLFPLFLLLLHLLLLLPHFALSCPIEWLSCDKPENGNGEVRSCGHDSIKCVSSTLHIQFYHKGKWYTAEGLKYPERTLTVRDYGLADHLQTKNCDFLYNFKSPVHSFDPSAITSLNSTASLFDCKADSYNFSADVFERDYRSSYCGDYDLYYSYQPGDAQRGDSCSVDANTAAAVEWKLSFQEDDSDGVEFILQSVGFSRNRKLSSECFSCRMSGGSCSSVDPAENNTCSCDRICPACGMSRKIKGIVIGASAVLFFACLAAATVFCWRKKYQKSKNRQSSYRSSLIESISSDPSALSKETEYQSNHHLTHIFSYKELEDATEGFNSSKEIGDGGFGAVYKGELRDGRIVAVKRLYESNYNRMEQFMNEVVILNQLRHPNLVTLYGCTSRQCRELLLVYEYVANGALADHLHGSRADERGLTWPIRMNIAIETATALFYLHTTEPQIIHRDVKTCNILLDEGFHVKVGDFGLSRLFPLDVTHVSTAPQGTPGYVDPEYYQCYQLTDKSDVYSFGVVLVELISSKPAVDMNRSRNEINLSNMAINKIRDDLVHELADPQLGFESDPDVARMIRSVAELSFLCLQADKDMRPSMEQVKNELVKIASGGRRDEVHVDVDKQMKDDAYLLSSSGPFSPDTVTVAWSSRTTTPNTST